LLAHRYLLHPKTLLDFVPTQEGFRSRFFLKARDISPTSDKYQELKDKGDSVLKEGEKARNKKNG
jgi:hypothetical protein